MTHRSRNADPKCSIVQIHTTVYLPIHGYLPLSCCENPSSRRSIPLHTYPEVELLTVLSASAIFNVLRNCQTLSTAASGVALLPAMSKGSGFPQPCQHLLLPNFFTVVTLRGVGPCLLGAQSAFPLMMSHTGHPFVCCWMFVCFLWSSNSGSLCMLGRGSDPEPHPEPLTGGF